jgi:hypothetical protein
MSKTKAQVICKNVFKSSDNKTIQAAFTRIMIELINQFEKNKGSIKQK